MHYYRFHIGDYVSHTRHLTLIEDLAYRRLLDMYYSSEKPIIAEQAARLIGMREHGQDVLAVLLEFFTETEQGFINKRADCEIEAFNKRSESASISASKRWNKESNADEMRSHTEPNANHKPITNNQEPIKDNTIASPSGFAEFWAAYPKKKNKGDAEKAWKVVKPSADLLAKILKAVEVAKAGNDWRKDNGQFIPFPATWLRAKGWEDGETEQAAPKPFDRNEWLRNLMA